MLKELKGQHKDLLSMILNKMKWAGKTYLEAKNETLLKWYNQHAQRNICIRTYYYYQARLKEHLAIKKVSRRSPDNEHGWIVLPSLTSLLPEGMRLLRRVGVDVYNVINEIKAERKALKTEASDREIDEASVEGLAPLGEIAKRVILDLKTE